MGTIITKNGRTLVINGDCVKNKVINTMTINGGRIFVDGKPLNELDVVEDDKVINITIEGGDVERIEVDYCNKIEVKGNARRVKTSSGDIEIHGDVEGDVHTNMGSITCGNVEGDCHTNMGSIYKR